ncbi:Oidioi.mRNA.OKI2018_I69.PAR.g12904.t1.cds [Oikopleura dioica]|uniref:Oidioi.mRNA.OKI2018_I69.PAR.g12904.t1.cds n=1 Tax=Oikopleura dioica TaxID=34765 RepID=A0ABN7S7M7_OIKDI|nr:Oidioi.mRNA.OKI2018_I69.PAR.g12904.t1.cds [Oikopleura dioica]
MKLKYFEELNFYLKEAKRELKIFKWSCVVSFVLFFLSIHSARKNSFENFAFPIENRLPYDASINFSLFRSFKLQREFENLKILEETVQTKNITRNLIVIPEIKLTYEKAQDFCESRDAHLPTNFQKTSLLNESFWVEGDVNFITKEANISAEINDETLENMFKIIEKEQRFMEIRSDFWHEKPCHYPMKTDFYEKFTKSFVCENDTFTELGLVKVWTSKTIHCKVKKLTRDFLLENNLFNNQFLYTSWIRASTAPGFSRRISGWTLAEAWKQGQDQMPICYPDSWVKHLVQEDSELRVSLRSKNRVLCIQN